MISISRRAFVLIFLIFSSVLEANTIVNDITNINPIEVAKVIAPTTIDEIVTILKNNKGPISIGGGRYSMGGQTATERAVQIDMRKFNKVVHFDIRAKKITVQAGIRWRDIQEAIDKSDLSVKIMQTYSNFTVGGSLSVNAHGRYVGAGPVINSVDSIKVVLADGNIIDASRTQNKDIFFAAIGGYGGMGVIAEATLQLVPNEKIRREVKELTVKDYKKYFYKEIRNNSDAVLHNGDIFPPSYNNVRLETWYRTNKPFTVKTRMIPEGQKYWLMPTAISTLSTIFYGSEIREKILEPIVRKTEMVVWRNYEASYDVAQLEPSSPRLLFTYVLQEYFVPVEKFDEFIAKMKKVFQKYAVNIVNVSIRHSPADPESILAWAPTEVFSFVVYYKQSTTDKAKEVVARWTREMIDEVLSVNGAYYLPYQIHATNDQFKKAYPRYQIFFGLKKKMDPENKFRNKLWDSYYK
jgi:FAD/FMN-containing dehydrogenase